MSRTYYGKYRGKVVANDDSAEPGGRLGRLLVVVPMVDGAELLRWAMPCVPFAGIQQGMVMLPPEEANVWVEFEAGDPDRAIWSGCFWGEGEFPAEVTDPMTRLIQMPGISIMMKGLEPGGVTIQVTEPLSEFPMSLSLVGPAVTITAGESSIVLNAENITVRNGETSQMLSAEFIKSTCVSSLAITGEGIVMKADASTAELTSELVQISSGGSGAKISAETVAVNSGESSIDLNATGVSLTGGESMVQVCDAGIELNSAGASVSMTAGTVNVNEGALVVL